MKRYTAVALLLSWVPQWFFIDWCRNNPEWVDQYYGEMLYPYLQSFRSYCIERLAFSFGDILYLAILISGIAFVISNRKQLIQKPFVSLSNSIALLAVIHLFFQLSWGLNYYKTPLEGVAGKNIQYEEWELQETLDILIQKTEALHKTLAKNDSLPVPFPLRKSDYLRELSSNPVKQSLWSLPISYMGVAGYLNPFTGEAHVNYLQPTLGFITTAAHEKGHQRGIAPENEANFYAFTTTYQHKNLHIRYAAYSFALRYCWSALHRLNSGCASERTQQLLPGIRKEYRVLQHFWMQYQNPFQPIIDRAYDRFLKANGQQSGRQSYSQVVALLISNRNKL